MKIKNKLGVSIMIGYVLLVVGAIVMGGIVYAWMKTYVPQETIECPDGVSFFVHSSNCEKIGEQYSINLSIINNGRFGIDGYFIKATNNPDIEIATIDISSKLQTGGNAQEGIVLFSSVLEPGEGAIKANYLADEGLYLIEVTPIRYEVIEGRSRLVTCGSAKIKERLNCPIDY